MKGLTDENAKEPQPHSGSWRSAPPIAGDVSKIARSGRGIGGSAANVILIVIRKLIWIK
jgi:hypothetical protein